MNIGRSTEYRSTSQLFIGVNLLKMWVWGLGPQNIFRCCLLKCWTFMHSGLWSREIVQQLSQDFHDIGTSGGWGPLNAQLHNLLLRHCCQQDKKVIVTYCKETIWCCHLENVLLFFFSFIFCLTEIPAIIAAAMANLSSVLLWNEKLVPYEASDATFLVPVF